MPSSQAAAANDRRSSDRTVPHEPPKLKTALKTPTNQATNPLQFVKVGPCSLYRTAQEQLQKVQEVKKVKPEVKDEAEDWQSNLDNWKSSRRKRQEHIIERVVEVKKLTLEEQDRQRRRSGKTFSEMMENRGRKLSLNLYPEDDSNDLSDLGIGTSSGKSSLSGDAHDDNQSVLSDRDSELDKSHSDVDNIGNENGTAISTTTPSTITNKIISSPPSKKETFNNGFHKNSPSNQEYDSATTATASSPEPEDFDSLRNYTNNRPVHSSPHWSYGKQDSSINNKMTPSPQKINDEINGQVVKVDINKRREIFEKASRESVENNKANNVSKIELANTKSIKERLSILERQKSETEIKSPRHSVEPIRERYNWDKLALNKEDIKARISLNEELEGVKPLKERLETLGKYVAVEHQMYNSPQVQINGNLSTKCNRLNSIDINRKDGEKSSTGLFNEQQTNRNENSTPSERSSSPDSEYRAPRTTFHQSLDSLDADASSGPDTFERVQSLEELDPYHQSRRYPASNSSAEILNDTDREDSGIHTADVSCSVSQADEPIEEDMNDKYHQLQQQLQQQVIIEEKTEFRDTINMDTSESVEERVDENEESNCNAVLNDMEEETEKVEMEESVEIAKEVAVVMQQHIVSEAEQQQHQQQNQHQYLEESLKEQNHKEREEKVEVIMNEVEKLKIEDDVIKLIEEVEEIVKVENLIDTPVPAVRPNTLALERTTSICSDFVSPLSPVGQQILPLSFSSDEEIVTGLSFPLGPPTSVEPPKEKPPPPPIDLSDEENHPIEPLKRLNSTRRIKKEMRSRRSDFLGIEGFNDEELERELTLTKPPDMAAILAEERRIEQLHRRSYDTDSNYEQDSSHERDSGVELGQAEDWTKQPVSPDMSQHSRQSSEPFGASVTSSEEDEISKKEREIIDVLEREEQWRYENNREINSDIGEKLAHKLRELEEEKMQLERERAISHEADNQRRQRQQEPNPETLRMNEENLRKQEEIVRQQEKQVEEKKHHDDVEKEDNTRLQDQMDRRSFDRRQDIDINSQEKNLKSPTPSNEEEYSSRQDVLRVERELLQLEQEELKRQRNNLAYREQKQQQLAEQLQEQWKSLQDVAAVQTRNHYNKPQAPPPVNYRASMPNLQMHEMPMGPRRRPPPPPPIPPAKPLRLVEQRQRDVTIRNSRIPSADSIPQQVETPLRSSCSISSLSNGQQQPQLGQQMSRQTLQALSAVPRPRMIQADQWVQRRKSDVPRGTHDYSNYQHWLIQEAEQRRITEKNQRTPPTQANRKPHVTGTSVPYATPVSTRPADNKPLPDSIIQTLTQRVQSRVQDKPSLSPRRRLEHSTSQEHLQSSHHYSVQQAHKPTNLHQSQSNNNSETQEKMLSVSGKKKCSHCGDELGRGAAMIIESLRLFYHMECFKCCVCHVRLGDGLMGTDVRVRNHKLHCHNCYSSDDGVKFSCV